MNLTELSKQLEHYETPEWAANAILDKESIVGFTVDPCAGTMVLGMASAMRGGEIISFDLHNWRLELPPGHITILDWLKATPEDFLPHQLEEFTVFMNPPFSKACQFVQKSFDLGAKKIICFQRFAWWESRDRKHFWESYPPNRVYICGDRAQCWRHDLPKDEKGNRYDPETGRKLASSPTAHAWFVWDQSEPHNGTILGHIWRDK